MPDEGDEDDVHNILNLLSCYWILPGVNHMAPAKYKKLSRGEDPFQAAEFKGFFLNVTGGGTSRYVMNFGVLNYGGRTTTSCSCMDTCKGKSLIDLIGFMTV